MVAALAVVAVLAGLPACDNGPEGHTRITMRASTVTDGGGVDASTMRQAQQILLHRFASAGIAGASASVHGDTITVYAPGRLIRKQIDALVVPAALRMRLVLGSVVDPTAIASASPTSTVGSGNAGSGATRSGNAGSGATGSGSTGSDPAAGTSPSPDPPTLAQVQNQLGVAYQAALRLTGPVQADSILFAPFTDLTPAQVAVLPATMQYAVPTITCRQLDARPGDAILAPDQQVTACDATTKYLLDAAKVTGTDISDSTAATNPDTGGWQVTVKFTTAGQSRWTALTQEAVNRQDRDGRSAAVAITLDTTVLSAPTIRAVIVGDAVIGGGRIDRTAALRLAAQLKFGALPVTLTITEMTLS